MSDTLGDLEKERESARLYLAKVRHHVEWGGSLEDQWEPALDRLCRAHEALQQERDARKCDEAELLLDTQDGIDAVQFVARALRAPAPPQTIDLMAALKASLIGKCPSCAATGELCETHRANAAAPAPVREER